MKILYTLYPLYPDKPGGMEMHVLDLVREMINRGHDVHVVCPKGMLSDWYKNEGAKVLNLQLRFDLDPQYIYNLIQYLKKENFNIIHSHDLKSTATTMIATLFSPGAKLITHTHTPISDWPTPDIIKELFKQLFVVVYSLGARFISDKEIALTESIKNTKVKKGIPEQKIVIIPNAVDCERFAKIEHGKYKKEICDKYGISSEAFIFGNVSRLSEEKGHDTLIKAFKDFLKNHLVIDQNVALLICGGGVLEEKYRKEIKELGLEEKIKITGVFEESEKSKYYSAFDAFVFPSLAEGFGIVLLEAMSAGLPSICSNLPVLEEVAGSTAFYFDTGNSQDLTQKMIDLYSRRFNLSGLGQNAQSRVKDLYTIEKFGNSYETLYQNLLETK